MQIAEGVLFSTKFTDNPRVILAAAVFFLSSTAWAKCPDQKHLEDELADAVAAVVKANQSFTQVKKTLDQIEPGNCSACYTRVGYCFDELEALNPFLDDGLGEDDHSPCGRIYTQLGGAISASCAPIMAQCGWVARQKFQPALEQAKNEIVAAQVKASLVQQDLDDCVRAAAN
jgi:hypothetical protein